MVDVERERRALTLFDEIADIELAERESWIVREVEGDAALEKRLRALLAADERAGLRTGGAWEEARGEAGAMPTHIAGYRITARIGEGGMGSVYRGERDRGDFHHVVAIKVIKPGLLSDALGERFRRERQTLAQLSHPNIAQLFDGGEMPDGAPYIVMEYVDGRPLERWLAESAPSRTERLTLFRAICGAVGFAHRSLIVHRDLTPSNILVARDGTVKLIDFGIAKASDVPEAGPVTSSASIAGLSLTPGYAAPERITSAKVSTAADIYSLGRLLARLEPSKDAEFAAIVARATATDPNNRYSTAEALASDVAAWNAGWPVGAMDGGGSYATRKFIARHRLPIAAAGLALLLLIGTLVYALVANQRAQIARADAEARFAQTRAIAKSLLFDVFDEVSRSPGSTRARQQLAETGVAYLDALSQLKDVPRDVRLEAGLGYLRLAEVVGGGQAASLAHYKDGDALLAKGEAMLAPLHHATPGDPAVASAYAALLNEQSGVNLYNNGKTQLAREQARRAVSILEPFSKNGDVLIVSRYMTALQSDGDSYQWDNDYETARRLHERAEAFAAALPANQQRQKQVMSARAANLRLLGETYHKLKLADQARTTLERVLIINRALVATAPDDPALKRKLINALRYAAVVHRTNGRDEAARVAITEAATHSLALSARDPDDGGSLHQLALVQEVQGQILADLGQFSESFATGRQVIAGHRKIVALAGNAAGARRSLAAAMRTTGGNHYNGGDYSGACALWREALSIYRELDRAGTLSDADRKGSMAEMIDYVSRACDGGSPRPGLGPDPL